MDCDCTESCAMADQFTPATREIMVFTKSAKRYFDLDAVRTVNNPERMNEVRQTTSKDLTRVNPHHGWESAASGESMKYNPLGAPPLDWWNLPWDRVDERLVKAMCPSRVCRTCGNPSRRLTQTEYVEVPNRPLRSDAARRYGSIDGKRHNDHRATTQLTIGWTDCGHDDWRPGVVFDPFPLVEGEPMPATFYIGDAIEVMGKLPENSVDLILTSPPFLALRSYLPADHPDKALEGGSQSTPGEFIDWLLDVAEACDRVLAPHGSLCIELGDTYSGSGPGETTTDGKWSADSLASKITSKGSMGWPLAKSLSLIPESFRWAMVYGRNPFTGRTTDPWRLRNVIRWVRPNPPVGALGDKFRPATSELMVFCKSAKRYFDLDAVREPFSEASVQRATSTAPGHVGRGGELRNDFAGIETPYRLTQAGAPPLDWWNIPLLEGEEETRYGPGVKTKPAIRHVGEKATESHLAPRERGDIRPAEHPLGSPPLDWWNIPPGGYEGAHYAVFPPELCVKPVKAMCPEKVCRVCGEPSRRIVETDYESDRGGPIAATSAWRNGRGGEIKGMSGGMSRADRPRAIRNDTTTGWTDCGHNDFRAGLVLDPFVGSGTTLMVATGHGRDAIGIDLDSRNFDLALERVGPFILTRGEIDEVRPVWGPDHPSYDEMGQ